MANGGVEVGDEQHPEGSGSDNSVVMEVEGGMD